MKTTLLNSINRCCIKKSKWQRFNYNLSFKIDKSDMQSLHIKLMRQHTEDYTDKKGNLKFIIIIYISQCFFNSNFKNDFIYKVENDNLIKEKINRVLVKEFLSYIEFKKYLKSIIAI